MTQLPAGWSTAPLGEVCRVVSGATPKTGRPDYWGEDIEWLTPKDMSLDRSKTLHRGLRRLSRSGYDSCSAQLFPEGSVIVSSRAPVGYVTIAGRPMCTNQGCKTAVPPEFIDPNFLYWFLLASTDDLQARASGTTFKELSAKEFGRTELKWPALPMQRRIVAIVEDHLSRLDAADAGLAAASHRLQAYESTALAAVSEGYGRPLADVAQIQGGIQKQPKRAPVDHAYPFLRVANVTSAGLDLGDIHRIELFQGEIERFRLIEGDLLVVEGNGSSSQIGRAVTWDGSIDPCVHQNHLIRVRPLAALHPRYLEAVWNSPQNRRALTNLSSSSSGLHTLSVSKLKTLSIPTPAVERQKQIVDSVVRLRDRRTRLGREVASARLRAYALRRSILVAGFSGRLTGRSGDLDVIEELAEDAAGPTGFMAGL